MKTNSNNFSRTPLTLICLLLTAAVVPCGGMASCNPNPCPSGMPYLDPVTGQCTSAPADGGVIVIPGTDPPIPGTGGLPREPGTTTQPSTNPDPGAVDLLIYGLNGRWTDNSRDVCIQHTGSGVNAWYIQEYECDHDDGTGSTSTNVDFEAQIAGNMLTGTTSVCSHGHDDRADNGIKNAAMTATVSDDGKSISGTWHNNDTGNEDPITLTRKTVGNCQVP